MLVVVASSTKVSDGGSLCFRLCFGLLHLPKYLIEEVADVVGGELLGSQQLVQVTLHQALDGNMVWC